jgi:hypothetical protein
VANPHAVAPMDPEAMLAAAWQCIHAGRLLAACDLLELLRDAERRLVELDADRL